ncbi:hypothetical protein TI39_contig627g00011 [Zymoseptoria brevis]|uniref:Alcohol dehydrogenase-like N-terminal domain-containing protein n=1 Tax=Zymoseptoria brevis TaxID=1047168 RepID=A0A0F4GHF5_9PEZI|nr:hypothetical protein TI39_contig627g00011 [Zymoseptoria brevis]
MANELRRQTTHRPPQNTSPTGCPERPPGQTPSNGRLPQRLFDRDRPEPPPTWPQEFTLGHEGAGEIVALGSEVSKELFNIGDRVAIHCVPGCHDCIPCNNGWPQACREPGYGGYGLGRDGFFAECVACRADAAVKIPEGVRIQDAAISPDALLTAYHAVKHTADVKPDETIAIFGLGGLGLNGVQVAKHLGVKRIIVCDN